jgi:hypothetical protein
VTSIARTAASHPTKRADTRRLYRSLTQVNPGSARTDAVREATKIGLLGA